MGFTAAELAEMARADAEIEATFRLTNEDIALGRQIDREAVLEGIRMQETGRKAKHIHPRAVYQVTRIKTGRAVVGTLEECAEQLGVKKATLEKARWRWLNQNGHRRTKWKIEKLGERRWKGWEEATTGPQGGANDD